MKPTKSTICFVVLLVCSSAFGVDHYVPQEYATIQAAIDASQDSDTVILAPQTYRGLGNRDISFKGKKITVSSTDPHDPLIVDSTILNCERGGRGFVFNSAEGQDSKLTGLTITNGYSFLGGAIYCHNGSSPVIANCVIVSNSGGFGGGITCANTGTQPKITNCQIKANSALVGGGGIYCTGASPTIRNCIISGNYAPQGGAIYSHNPGNSILANCTIATNVAPQRAGGVYCYNSSNLTAENTILWNDAAAYAPEVLLANIGAPTSMAIAYSDIQNQAQNVVCETGCTVTWGNGAMSLDPCFVQIGTSSDGKTSADGDYHLLADSPCVNAGDPAFVAQPVELDIDGGPRVSGGRIDIGADEREAAIAATVALKPKSLNLASKAKTISCDIRLPEAYSVRNIVVSSVRLSGEIAPVWSTIDEDGVKLLLKFDRAQVEPMLTGGENPVSLTVTGRLNDGAGFEGTDTIGVSSGNGNGKKNGKGNK